MQYHPDRNQNDAASEEKFKEVAAAYEFLTKGGNSADSTHGFNFHGGAEDILKSFFENMQAQTARYSKAKRSPKPRPGQHPIIFSNADVGEFKISLQQALFREEVTLKLNVKVACESCLANPQIWVKCTSCSACGSTVTQLKAHWGAVSKVVPCKSCSGRGWKRKTRCSLCSGNLVYFKRKDVTFRLPNNFKIGNKVRLAGKGNECWKARNSDVFLTPKIDVPDFSAIPEEQKKKLLELFKK
jgi:molecular chaperone DnaJ